MAVHEQIWVKVNAPVDSGIAGVVAALAEFDTLETVESCEGTEGTPAWVCFRYGSYWDRPWRPLAEFVLGTLGPALLDAVGDDAGVRIQCTPSGACFGEVTMRPGAALRVRAALSSIAQLANASRRRRSECCGGTSDTSPECCRACRHRRP